MTRCGVLGPVVLGTPPVSVGNERQRRILVSLLLAGDQGVAAERLIEQVWTEEDAPESARAALRTYTHRLRQLIPDGPQRIVATNGRYVLTRTGLEVDSDRFEQLLEQDAACDDAAERLRLLTEALALWRGPAYDDLGDLPWLTADRVRLLELRLTAQEALLTLRLDAGDRAPVAVEAAYLLQQHPYREALLGTQMIALYRCNRQADALAAYREQRALLIDELGIDTSPELQDLERRILQQDPTLLTTPTSRRQVRGYVIGEVLRPGPRSTVMRAVQQATGRAVAVELFQGDDADSEAFIRSFDNDARVLARLQHPHIAPVLDFWREPGRACLVSALVPTTLATAWRDQPWPAERVARAVDDAASALEAAHQQGVCHGGLTGDTVLLDDDGRVLVTGFRVAPRAPRPELAAATDVEALGRLLAEGLARARPDDPRADAWADVAARAQSATPTTRFDSVAALREALAVGAVAASPLIANPYRGLEAFDEQDAAVFSGRESVIEVLLGRIAVSPLCAVVGPSGVGKSSVVLAGLVPAVRSGALPGEWLVARMRPTETPVTALQEALRSVWPGGVSAHELDLRHHGLVDAARIITSRPDTHLLLVIDQFEATWSAGVLVDSERGRFLELLVESLDEPDLDVRVVLTLRADRYDEPLAHAGLARQLESATVALGPLADADVALAVSTPAARAGVSIAPELAVRLVTDSAESPGSLPLLQFTLTELFDRRSGPELTLASYEDLGGLAGALVGRAEAAFAEIEGGAGTSTRRLMGRLVTIDTEGRVNRVRAHRSELLRLPGVTEGTLAALSEARLIVLDRDETTREPTVELAHEALLTAWPRLRAWMAEDQALLVERHVVATSATAWRADNRDEAGLLQGPRLERAEELRNARPDLLNPDELQFVEASTARREALRAAEVEAIQREARASRRLRMAFRLVASAAAVILVVSALAISQWRRAASERDTAALSALVARALQESDLRPKVALRMAAAAYLADPGTTGQRALLGVLNNVRPTSRVLLQGVTRDAPLGSVCRAQLSRGPEVVALGNPTAAGSELVAHNLATGAVRRMVSPLRCSALAIGDGRFVGRIADGTRDRAAYAVVDEGAVAARLPADVVAVHDVVEDGVLVGVATGEDDITLALVDPSSGAITRRSEIPVRSTILSERGDFAVVVADDDARIVEVGSLTASAALDPGPATYAWKPDGSEVVAFGHDGTAHRFGVDGSLLTIPSNVVLPEVGDVVAYSFAPDGTRVAVAGTSGVQLLDYPTLGPIGQRLFLDADVVDATWLTNTQLALVGPDGSVEVVDWVSNRLERTVRHTRRGEPVSIAAPGVGAAQALDGRWTLVDLVKGEEVAAWSQPGDPLVVIDRDRALTPLATGSPPTLLDKSGQQVATGTTPMADPGAALSDPFVDSSRGLVRLVVKAAPSDATHVVVRTLDLANMEVSETAPIEVDPWTRDPDGGVDGFSAVGLQSRTLQTWRWDGGVVAPPLPLAAGEVAAGADLARRHAVVVTEDGGAVVYNLDDQAVLHTLRAEAQPEAPVMVADGRAVIRTRAGDLVLWDLERGVQLGVVAVVPVQDSTSDRGLAAVGQDNWLWFTRGDEFVRVDVAAQRWRDLACDIAPQPLSAAEVAAYVPAEFDYREGCA